MRLLLLFILVNANLYAQNLVPNPSFEDYDTCPNSSFQIHYATGWHSFRNTPDYFNKCASQLTGFSVPNSLIGHQNPASGNAFAGFYSYFPSSSQPREILGCALTTPLIIGVKYFVTFKLNLCQIDSSMLNNCATDHIGVLFTKNPYSFSSPITINNNAHVFSNSIITDTLNWVTIRGSFIADSSYQYISIGNLFDDITTNKTYFFSSSSYAAYYFIDDVCVSSDSLYCQNYTYTSLNSLSLLENNFDLYPNPVSDFLNIESSILSENYFINLFELTGKLVLSQKLEFSFKNRVELKDIPNGVYLLQINKNGFGFNQKIVVNH